MQPAKQKRKWSWKKFLKRTAVTLTVIYIGICTALYFLQDSLMFHPRPFSKQKYDSLCSVFTERNFETLSMKMADGVTVSGWLVKDTGAGKLPLVIYYPGNAEEVSHMVEKKKNFPGCHLALLNYRGYGISEGAPSEEKFFSDALEIFDVLKKRADVDGSEIIVFGRSIGTGVASHVTKNRAVKATILATPYDCMKDLSQEKYPYVPVALLLKHAFNSIEDADKIETPVLCFIASEDEIIPPWHAYRLMLAWKGKKTVKLFEGASHNNIVKRDGYWSSIRGFITKLRLNAHHL